MRFDRLVVSTMQRAKQTAEILRQYLPVDTPVTSDSMLDEGYPCPVEPPLHGWRPLVKSAVQGSRIEAAFRQYFHRALAKHDVAGKKDHYELIVCHANVIRYFVCRALQFPPEGWLRMSLANSSITYVVIRPDGRVSLKSIGDCGHLQPIDKLSYA